MGFMVYRGFDSLRAHQLSGRATDKPPETIGLLASPGFAKVFKEIPSFNAI